MSHRRSTIAVESLDAHPNAAEVRGILSRLPGMPDSALPVLADAWHNTTLLAEARRRSLEPDSPLVLEVLACFETVQSLFADDIRGGEDYVTIDPDVTAIALKAVRDAIAAAYARPILTGAEHNALMRAWRCVYPTDHIEDPDLGIRADDVTSLLAAIPRLAGRCHDASAAAEYASILVAGGAVDEDIRCAARDEAWHAAVLTSRRRVWQLLRRSGAEGLSRLLHDLPPTPARRGHRPRSHPLHRRRVRPAGLGRARGRHRRRPHRAGELPHQRATSGIRRLTATSGAGPCADERRTAGLHPRGVCRPRARPATSTGSAAAPP